MTGIISRFSNVKYHVRSLQLWFETEDYLTTSAGTTGVVLRSESSSDCKLPVPVMEAVPCRIPSTFSYSRLRDSTLLHLFRTYKHSICITCPIDTKYAFRVEYSQNMHFYAKCIFCMNIRTLRMINQPASADWSMRCW